MAIRNGQRNNTARRGATSHDADLHDYVRTMPHSADAEAAILGAMMIDANTIAVVTALLHDEAAFYDERNRAVFSAITALANRNEPVDVLTVTNELRRSQTLETAGGLSYVSGLCISTPTSAHAEYHAKIVIENSIKRRLIDASLQVSTEAYEPSADAFEVLDKAGAIITLIESSITVRRATHGSALLRQSIAELEARAKKYESGERITGIPSGFDDLDRMTGGFQRGELILIAARPSMGKTGFATDISDNAAAAGHSVLFATIEMTAQAITMRRLSARAKIDSIKLRDGNLSNDEWQAVMRCHHLLADRKIYIDDSPGVSIMELRARARIAKREHGIEMLVVDYLQLMHAPKSESREREISMISRGLKLLAKELDIPVIALSQLNRSVESRGDKRPMLSDLRESGSLEQDADVVMFVHRPEYYGITVDEDGNSTLGIAEVIIGKQRNGPTGITRLAFLREVASFENLVLHRDQQQAPRYLDNRYERDYVPVGRSQNGYAPIEGEPF